LAGIEPGDEVLVPSFTFIATAAAVAYLGARPVFVDCSADSWNLDPGLVEEVLTERAAAGRLPSAVITVDLYGETADYAALESLCRTFDVPLVEDSAEALGASYRGRPAGSFGVAGIFSFNGNKIITTSGGGMLVTESPELAQRARHLATQAREPFPHYEHATVGYNYRLSNLLAALGRAQLRGLDSRIEHRRLIDATYTEGLADLPGVSPMPRNRAGTSNYWLTCVLIDPDAFGVDRERVRLALEDADIESRPTWKPLHLQPVFSGISLVGPGHCDRVFDRGLCLPTGSGLSAADQSRVIEIITAECRA
jgi:dTDP-4-amino-4,6-dideoxygalactose transaminase